MKKRQRGRGEHSRPGAPHQRADGKWVQYKTVDGKRHKRIGATKREVQDKITALLVKLKNPGPPPREQGPTLTELCDKLLTKYDAEGSTYRTYAHGLAHWRGLLGDETRTITDKAVQAAVDALEEKHAPSTVGVYFAALRLALGADHPAFKEITLPEEDDEVEEPTILVPSDLAERLQTAAQHHPLGIGIGLGFGAGLRAGEAAALRWQDVDFANGRLFINGTVKRASTKGWYRGKTKSRKTRLVLIHGALLDWLDRHQRIQVDTAALAGYPAPEFVIADPATGQGVKRFVLVRVLRRLLAQVCTPEEFALYGALRYHALKHNHISGLLSQGAGVADVAARVGTTPEVLMRYYAHAIPGADARLATLAGALFPVQATRQATRRSGRHQDAAGRGNDLTLCKAEPSRTEPHDPAGSPTNSTSPTPDTRSIPQEPAGASNPISNPESKGGAR